MIYLLTIDGKNVEVKAHSNGRQKSPHVCTCDDCDIACDCPENQHCFHHTAGVGGICVTNADGKRVAWYPHVVMTAECIHSSETDCEWANCSHRADIRDEQARRAPGPPRRAGAQRMKQARR